MTDARLWMSRSLGMAADRGMYEIVVAGPIFPGLILAVRWRVTRHQPGGRSANHRQIGTST